MDAAVSYVAGGVRVGEFAGRSDLEDKHMSADPQLFRINPDNHESEAITEVEFAQLGFQERRDIQEWVAANPGILGEDLLIIGKEFSGFDRTNERLDLLAVDADGRLVVIELKRDDTGADAHWQAIKYASYLHRVDTDRIIEILADYADVSKADAANKLLQHLNADDLNALNNDQRIILASHRFAPEVTSAALWLNEKAPGDNLITCIQLTPYRDAETNSLYVQANTIIPVPGAEAYMIGVGDSSDGSSSVVQGSSSLAQTFARNAGDGITRFLREVADRAINGLSDNIKPDKRSRWAGGHSTWRYYHLWYSRPPWSNWGTSFRIDLWRGNETESWISSSVSFRNSPNGLEERIRSLKLHDEQQLEEDGIVVPMGIVSLEGDSDDKIASIVRHFIQEITPIVDEFEEERNEEDA